MNKRVYLSIIMHANMQYDRFGKEEILGKFPTMYRYIVASVERFPEVRIGFELSGVTALMLKRHAPDVLDGMRRIAAAKRAIFLGTYFSNPLNMCVDEHFNSWNAWLGVQIVRRELGEPTGFYPQENSYHPGMPAVVRKLGLAWMTVPALLTKRTFLARGLGGETIVGVPTEVVDAENLERLYDEYPDNALIVPIVDCEYHPNFEYLVQTMASMRQAGRQIEWISIPDYLRLVEPEESRDVPPCTSVDSLFARWTTSPENLRLHEKTMEAIRLYHDAVALRDMILADGGPNIDGPYRDSVLLEERDVVTAEIEDVSDLPDVAAEYLCKGGEVSTLTRAFYLLLWAMNSDARGWYPLVQKARQRQNDLDVASGLCRDLIERGLNHLRARQKLSGAEVMLMYNPHGREDFDVRLNAGTAVQFDDLPKNAVRNFRGVDGVETTVRVPGGGTHIATLRYHRSQSLDRFTWSAGSSIEQGSSRLSLKDYDVEYRQGDRQMTVCLALPTFVEVKNGTIEVDVIKQFSFKPVFVEIGTKLDPCLRIGRKLNESIYVTEHYTLKQDRLECEWVFYFPRDVILGNLTWETNTIEAVVRGGFRQVACNIPGGVYDYSVRTGRVTGLNYAIGLADGGGIALVSLSGSQGFRLDSSRGELAVSLGASTQGPSSVPARMTVDPDRRNGSGIWQFEKFAYVTFHGTYRHRFVVLPFRGSREESGIERKAELCDKNVYLI